MSRQCSVFMCRQILVVLTVSFRDGAWLAAGWRRGRRDASDRHEKWLLSCIWPEVACPGGAVSSAALRAEQVCERGYYFL